MLHPETYLVTPDNGPRLAGPPDRCFYCGEALGSEHKPECVCRHRTVLVRVVITYAVEVPESWTAEDINFQRNGSSWCASNIIEELQAVDGAASGCLCNHVQSEYVGEATEEDEQTRLVSERITAHRKEINNAATGS